MKSRDFTNPTRGALLLALLLLPLTAVQAAGGVEDSYHGQMGRGTGLGMLEKWCALPNFSYYQEDQIKGWTGKPCNGCHIGAPWNPTKPEADCIACHTAAEPTALDAPTIDKCLGCHWKDTAKRGDVFEAAEDVHIAYGYVCQDCHRRVTDDASDHQFLKGTAIDTTEDTMMGTLSCTSACHGGEPYHDEQPHADTDKGTELNNHVDKVACETCHTGLRPAAALESRKWNMFKFEDGKITSPVTKKRAPGWLPDHKWYDNTGPGDSGDFHLPILTHTERRGLEGAKIYPFNPVTVDWYVKRKQSSYDEVITVAEVKGADTNGSVDGVVTVTLDEMQDVYRKARLVTADMNFSISHSVMPASKAFKCSDCHGKDGWVLDWNALGYDKDPRSSKGRGKKK